MNEEFRRYLAKNNKKGDLLEIKSTFDIFPQDVFSSLPGQQGMNEFASSFEELNNRMNALPGIQKSWL